MSVRGIIISGANKLDKKGDQDTIEKISPFVRGQPYLSVFHGVYEIIARSSININLVLPSGRLIGVTEEILNVETDDKPLPTSIKISVLRSLCQ